LLTGKKKRGEEKGRRRERGEGKLGFGAGIKKEREE
jgi:hypothetical protein